MQSFRILDGQARYLVAAVTLLIATLITAIMPIIAGAAQVTTRSIEMSSSAADASGVTYEVNFTSVGAAEAVIVDFCSNSPLIATTCDALPGFSLSSATTSGGFTKDAGASTATRLVTAGTVAAATPITFTISGVHNPTAVDTFYARILTIDADNIGDYTSTVPGTYIDEGGVALSTTETIGVSAAVLESMTFCVSGEAVEILEEGCTGTLTTPTLKLGKTTGNVIALSSDEVSTGSVYTQLSTNALGGAIVSIKSNADCGGLKRVGATVCDIAPALPAEAAFTDLTLGVAKFGVKLAAATDAGASANGTLQPASTSSYDTTNYKMNWVTGNLTGVSSTYGDPLLDTNNAPVNNKVMNLTFGAGVANNTPAGLYSADLSLVATGKF